MEQGKQWQLGMWWKLRSCQCNASLKLWSPQSFLYQKQELLALASNTVLSNPHCISFNMILLKYSTVWKIWVKLCIALQFLKIMQPSPSLANFPKAQEKALQNCMLFCRGNEPFFPDTNKTNIKALAASLYVSFNFFFSWFSGLILLGGFFVLLTAI